MIGINYDSPDAIRFAPVVPKALRAERKINGFKYRDAVLDITVKGYGDIIKTFKLDGKVMDEPVFPASVSGHHAIEVILADRFNNQMNINMVSDVRAPMVPFVRLSSGNTGLRWYAEEGAFR